MNRRSVQIALVVLASVIVAVGGFALYRTLHPEPSGPGDPGNSRLHQLAADPAFRGLPPEARSPRITLTPARWRTTPFQGAGAAWDGPSVILTFESSTHRRAIFDYYGRKVSDEGWHSTNIGPLGLPVTWQKTYANRARAALRLSWQEPANPPPGPVEYQLTGSITPYSSH